MLNLLEGYDTEHDTAAGINKCLRVLKNWRQQGIGPPYIRVGKTIYYERAAVLAWIRDQQVEPVRNRTAGTGGCDGCSPPPPGKGG